MGTILSIEDNPALQQSIGLALYQEGYQVHYAFQGKEGYDKILSLRPDLVLVDLLLPMQSGMEIVTQIRLNPEFRDLPFIVMTAMVDEENNLEKALNQQGNIHYIRKPFRLEELLQIIRRIFRSLPEKPQASAVSKGAAKLDIRGRTLWITDQLIGTISGRKAQILRVLLESTGPVRRQKLIDRVWAGAARENTLEKSIQRIREDLGPENAWRLVTTKDGYEFVG